MNTLYILSDLSHSDDKFKIGHHSGSLKNLISRYITAIPELKINYFVHTAKAICIENYLKFVFKDYRVINSNGNASEWISLPLNSIVNELLKHIDDHETLYDNNTIIIIEESSTIKIETITKQFTNLRLDTLPNIQKSYLALSEFAIKYSNPPINIMLIQKR